MGTISQMFNFDNIGGKIKDLAKWSCWITILLIWIATPIAFIVLIANGVIELCWVPLVAAIVMPIIVWISSWALYAFGEFVEDIHAMRHAGNQTGVTADREVETTTNTEGTTPETDPNAMWHKATSMFGGKIGNCAVCGKKDEPLVYYRFKDQFGQGQGYICYECFCKKYHP